MIADPHLYIYTYSLQWTFEQSYLKVVQELLLNDMIFLPERGEKSEPFQNSLWKTDV